MQVLNECENEKLKIPREGIRSFAGYLYAYGVNISAVRGQKRGSVGANDSEAQQSTGTASAIPVLCH